MDPNRAQQREEAAADRDVAAAQRDAAAEARRGAPGHQVTEQHAADDRAANADIRLAEQDREASRQDRRLAVEDRERAAQALTAALAGQESALDGLATRTVIGQATGLLMAQFTLAADDAFQVLVTESQHRNVKVRDIAAAYVAKNSE